MKRMLLIALISLTAKSADFSPTEAISVKTDTGWQSLTDFDKKAVALIRLKDPSFERTNFVLNVRIDPDSVDSRFLYTYRNKIDPKNWEVRGSKDGRIISALAVGPVEHHRGYSPSSNDIPPEILKRIQEINATNRIKIVIPTNSPSGPKH